jgi:hypothetical protein
LPAFAQNFTQSNLPIIIIETNGQTIPDEPKITVDMGIIWNGPGEINYVTDTFNNYNGVVGIELRGSSSQWFFPKKQYAVETRDQNGNNLNVSLLGLPSENDWILYAPYSDKTLMRNVLTYKLANDMGHYASRTVFCELVLNGDYKGVYVLMEKIKRDNNRVDITEMDDNDLAGDSLTGGYIIKIDKDEGAGNAGWASDYPPYPGAWMDVYYQYHYPKPEDIKYQQKQYIQQFVDDFETVMDGNNFNDPENGYQSIIDINSFTDFILINELTKNVDGYRISTFLHKDRDSKNGKLKAGPVWDFNITLGNADYYSGYDPEGWMVTSDYANYDGLPIHFWWKKLFPDPAFYQNCVLRWNVFRKTILHGDSINNFIEQTVQLLDEPQQRNFERWPILGEYIWPNYFIGDTYEEEVEFLKSWTADRIVWMDEQLKLQPVISEVNYNSIPANNAGDWIEIYNPTSESINLYNWKLKDGNDLYYNFPPGAYIMPESYLVICQNMVQFHAEYPDVENYIGDLQLEFSNEGASIQLYNADNVCVDLLTYATELPWPQGANGTANTIELIYYLTDNSKGESWQLSAQEGGSPGETNSVSQIPSLFINEFMADNDSLVIDEYGDFDDWIEIYNAADFPVNIGGMYLTDKLVVPQKFQIPNSNPQWTTIPANGFLLLWADKEPAQGILHLDFKLSKEKEQIGLFMADGFTVVDTLSFGQQMTNISYGRDDDGAPGWSFFNVPTPGGSNSPPVYVSTTQKEPVSIFPNPADNFLQIIFPAAEQPNSSLFIYNLYGELMIHKHTKFNFEKLNIGKLEPGIYILKIWIGNNEFSRRFIKL